MKRMFISSFFLISHILCSAQDVCRPERLNQALEGVLESDHGLRGKYESLMLDHKYTPTQENQNRKERFFPEMQK